MSVARARPAFTDAQRSAILSDGHTLLEAGAGSGKTTTLVGKIMHALGADVVGSQVARPCGLGEIAAITFTNAAAADLRRALRDRLREYSSGSEESHWRRLVYEVDRARIGTIHSFCGQLLREVALREGFDPAFAVLDDGEAGELREDCARRELYAALDRDDDGVGDLVFRFSPNGALEMIQAAMAHRDATRQARQRWCDGSGQPRIAELQRQIQALGGTWRRHDREGAVLAAAVLRLAETTAVTFDEALDREGGLDYDALIQRARDLLATPGGVVDGIRQRLRWLFIDEFQDTDPAQRDVAYSICGVREALAGDRTNDYPSLCIVGDPKQSIYGFRRADVTLWNAVARDFAALGAQRIALDVNFRSRAPIVGLVNQVFGGLMPDESASAPDYEVRYRALEAARAFDGDDDLVELLVLPSGEKAGERRAEEARLIARRIRAMVDGEQPVIRSSATETRPASWRDIALLFRSRTDVRLYEAELRRLRVPCYVASGDGFFATREVRDVRLLLAALADAHDDIAWVGLLRSPWIGLSDDALLALRLARPAVPFSQTLDVGLEGEDGAALAFARPWLEELRQLRDRVSCAALIDRALERTGYSAALLLRDGGDVAVGNLRKLIRVADGRPDDSLAGFVAYMAERTESGAREAEAVLHTADEDVVLLTTIHGAKGLEWPVVFLCDLDREKGDNGQAPKAYIDSSSGIAVKLVDPEAEKEERQCGAYECLKSAAADRDLAEDKRVWYVAATRARDRLVLCAQEPSSGDAVDGRSRKWTPAEWLLGGLTIAGDTFTYSSGASRWRGSLVRHPPAIEAVAPVEPPTYSAIVASARADDDVQRRIADVEPVLPLFRRSATELMTFAKQPDEHRRRYLLGLRGGRQATPRTSDAPALDARTTGDIVHAIMEMDGDAIDRDLDVILDRELSRRLGADNAATLPTANRDRIRRLVERTRGHPAVARLLSSGVAERELPFTWFIDVDGERSVMHGAMDLVAFVDEALEILDFKTHALAAGEETSTAAEYSLQRDLYCAALYEMIGTPAAFTLFFPETSCEVRQALEAIAVEAGRERVRTSLRDVRRSLSRSASP